MTSSRVFGSDDDERSRLLLLTDDEDDAAMTVVATFATAPRATRATARDVTIMMMRGSEGKVGLETGDEQRVFDICEAKTPPILRTTS